MSQTKEQMVQQLLNNPDCQKAGMNEQYANDIIDVYIENDDPDPVNAAIKYIKTTPPAGITSNAPINNQSQTFIPQSGPQGPFFPSGPPLPGPFIGPQGPFFPNTQGQFFPSGPPHPGPFIGPQGPFFPNQLPPQGTMYPTGPPPAPHMSAPSSAAAHMSVPSSASNTSVAHGPISDAVSDGPSTSSASIQFQNRCLNDMCPFDGFPCEGVMLKDDIRRIDCRKCQKSFIFNSRTSQFQETNYKSTVIP